MFFTPVCQSFCSQQGVGCLADNPWADTPRQTPTPQQTPPGDTPRHTPWADTPRQTLSSRHPPGGRYTSYWNVFLSSQANSLDDQPSGRVNECAVYHFIWSRDNKDTRNNEHRTNSFCEHRDTSNQNIYFAQPF